MTKPLTNEIIQVLGEQYVAVRQRFIFLDYDGTLVPFAPTPEAAAPTAAVLDILRALGSDLKNTVVLVSGRDHTNMKAWFDSLPIVLSAEHGYFLRYPGQKWQTIGKLQAKWKESVRPLLETTVTAVPRSFVEEKQTSLVWHYRQADVVKAEQACVALEHAIEILGLDVLHGDKVLEVRGSRSSKGEVIGLFLPVAQKGEAGFDSAQPLILIIGDDLTDETMFAAAPPSAVTIKVRPGPTRAIYRLADSAQTLRFLRQLLELSQT